MKMSTVLTLHIIPIAMYIFIRVINPCSSKKIMFQLIENITVEAYLLVIDKENSYDIKDKKRKEEDIIKKRNLKCLYHLFPLSSLNCLEFLNLRIFYIKLYVKRIKFEIWIFITYYSY